MTTPDQITAARHFLSGCTQAGLRRLVLSPGSRSTPLAIAAHRLEGLEISIHLDERSAAFAALGEAKASGEAVAVACTSGTAAANHLPAIAEANESNVPLISITADRPPEHIGWGVGQAFDQLGLFHRQVRAQITMPVGADGGLDHATRAGMRSVVIATGDRAGPVHVNWPFRLPVEPDDGDWPDPPRLTVERVGTGVATAPAVDGGAPTVVDSARRAVIVAGPGAIGGPTAASDRDAIAELAQRRSWPILADATSGLRGLTNPHLVDAADQVCASGAVPEVDLVIRVGDTPTAKSIRLWWERTETPQVLIDPHLRWHDPSHRSTHMWHGSASSLVRAATNGDRSGDAETWVELGRAARAAIDDVLRLAPFSEAHVAAALGTAAGSHGGDVVVVGSSSMPIRDIDSFFRSDNPTEVIANRGINGIDGVVSTAIGVARARPSARIAVLIGDVAALHDIGGILDAARRGTPLTIVVPNNDGGGIFSFLPIRAAIPADEFSHLFHTPHGSDFGFLGGHDGISHRRVDLGSIDDAMRGSLHEQGVSILEATVSTNDRLDLGQAIAAAVSRIR